MCFVLTSVAIAFILPTPERLLIDDLARFQADAVFEGQGTSKRLCGVRLAVDIDDATFARLVDRITGFPTVRSFTIDGTQITDSGLRAIVKLRYLRSLYVSMPSVSDATLGELARLKSLTRLEVRYGNATGTGFAKWRGNHDLRELTLDGCPISDLGLRHVGKLTSLRFLSLNDTAISDRGLEELKELKGLEHLVLSRTRINGSGLRWLAQLPDLHVLDLQAVKLGPKALHHIGNLKPLRELYLGAGQGVDGSDLIELVGLKRLTELGLTDIHITDSDLEIIGKMTSLETLLISWNPVTDAGVKHLSRLTNLGYLNISDTQVTKEGIKTLRKAIPHLKIYQNGFK